MKPQKIFIVAALAVLLLSSCGDDSKGTFWGETKYYSNFPFKSYEPVIMEKTLSFDFNDDARQRITSDIEFEVVEKDEHDKFVCPEGIVVCKNNEKCANNILKVKPTENEVILGIEFTEKARKGNHTLYLRATNTGGLDRIDYLELTNGFCVKKTEVMNPMAFILLWSIIVVIVILAVCFIASRIVNPSTKFSKLFIDYNDGAGEQMIKMGSAYKLLCTNKKTRVSVFSKFFVGVVKVEVNDFWTYPVTLKSGTRNNIRLLGMSNYQLDNDETVRKEPFSITNENGQKVTNTTA
jgi:hypothetical protein